MNGLNAETGRENGSPRPHVVIVGGGFGGLYAARRLGGRDVDVTLVDRRNFHLFQPLLYQVATGGLSPGEIASPLRSVVKKHRNVRVLQAEVVDFDVARRRVLLRDGELEYTHLIVAAGAVSHYFGRGEWAEDAPGLKTVEDALEMRRRILVAFEAAERETDPEARKAWLTFVVVGAGPTGVELAGAIGELAHHTLRGEFRSIDACDARVLLVEGGPRILAAYPEPLSDEALRSLGSLGVEVRTGVQVKELGGGEVLVRTASGEERIAARTVLWAAGMKASPLAELLSRRAGVETDRVGRVKVSTDLSLPGHAEIFAIGDLAYLEGADGKPLPGVAPVAMQQGRFVADRILSGFSGQPGKGRTAFSYHDKGSLAVIGRNRAVAAVNGLQFHGFPAWLVWVFVHLMFLVEFENQVVVMLRWAWSYVTRNRGARLVTPETPVQLRQPLPLPEDPHLPARARSRAN